MAASFPFVDDLIRDYLHFRGLTSTLRTFDTEISKSTTGQFRADRITEQLTLYIHSFDIGGLVDYWTQVEQRLGTALLLRPVQQQQQTNVLAKIRTNLYRCFLIHAIQSSKTDKIHEFFERLAKILQNSNDWSKEWFALPFIKNPEENATFQPYFSKQWNDLFWISLQNFLSMAFYHMTPPKLCTVEENNSQQFGNLISHQSTSTRTVLPPSARIDPSMTNFAEVLDEIQIPSNILPGTEQQRQSNATIMSKLRSNFLSNTKQSQPTTRSKLPSFSTASSTVSKSTFIPPTPDPTPTTGNQLLLSTDETTIPRTNTIQVPPTTAPPIMVTRTKATTISPDDANINSVDEEKLLHLAELRNHSSTIIDCKLSTDGTLYSTLDMQSYVKIWSATEDFDMITSLFSRSASLQCQTFDVREPLLYLGTSVSTVKVLHVLEKRITNETIIDKNYPIIMSIMPHSLPNRLFVSSASASRSNSTDLTRTRAGRLSILDLNTWTVERILVDNNDSFVTCMTVHADRQLLVLGFSDGRVAFYDTRSSALVHQKQRHSRLVQDLRFVADELYSIGNENMIIKSSLSSFDQPVQSFELPYSAVGPFQASISPPSNDNTTGSPSLQRIHLSLNNNNFLPMGNIFDFDPYDADRLLTCGPTNARFYRLSLAGEDENLQFPSASSASYNSSQFGVACSCVHWNKERDMCMMANTNGIVQLYRRMNRVD